MDCLHTLLLVVVIVVVVLISLLVLSWKQEEEARFDCKQLGLLHVFVWHGGVYICWLSHISGNLSGNGRWIHIAHWYTHTVWGTPFRRIAVGVHSYPWLDKGGKRLQVLFLRYLNSSGNFSYCKLAGFFHEKIFSFLGIGRTSISIHTYTTMCWALGWHLPSAVLWMFLHF